VCDEAVELVRSGVEVLILSDYAKTTHLEHVIAAGFSWSISIDENGGRRKEVHDIRGACNETDVLAVGVGVPSFAPRPRISIDSVWEEKLCFHLVEAHASLSVVKPLSMQHSWS